MQPDQTYNHSRAGTVFDTDIEISDEDIREAGFKRTDEVYALPFNMSSFAINSIAWLTVD